MGEHVDGCIKHRAERDASSYRETWTPSSMIRVTLRALTSSTSPLDDTNGESAYKGVLAYETTITPIYAST